MLLRSKFLCWGSLKKCACTEVHSAFFSATPPRTFFARDAPSLQAIDTTIQTPRLLNYGNALCIHAQRTTMIEAMLCLTCFECKLKKTLTTVERLRASLLGASFLFQNKTAQQCCLGNNNGGSGWTRTTDLTLISRSFISLNPIE